MEVCINCTRHNSKRQAADSLLGTISSVYEPETAMDTGIDTGIDTAMGTAIDRFVVRHGQIRGEACYPRTAAMLPCPTQLEEAAYTCGWHMP